MIRASGALTASQGRDYYDKEYSRGDYYTEDARAIPGVWSGRGAEKLGLEGSVEKEVFEAVLEGKAGPSGDQLIPGQVGTGKHRAGWDFTCSPEKSVSIMALVGGDAGILDDVKAANAKAMAELERFAMAWRKDHQLEATGTLVIASFQHETSRRLDPQLHIHNVVMNMTRREDGKFVGLEVREMFAAQAFLKSVFHADLAQRLHARGYDIEIRECGVVALREVPKTLVEAFSQRRRKDIEPYLEARGQSGAKAAENAAIRTRKVKDKEVSREALKAFWAATVKGQGVDLQAIKDRAEKVRLEGLVVPSAEDRQASAQASLAFAMEHVSERKAAFTGRELLGAALRHGMGAITLEDVRQVLPRAKDLVQVDADGSPSKRFTTSHALRLELWNLEAMRQGQGAGKAILGRDRFEPTRPLSDGQRQVAEHILTSRDQVLAVEGKAGAGKTYTLQAVVTEARERGWGVRGFAPDTSAVKTLSEETGISGKTLAALAQEKTWVTDKPQLWLVDEAGKMSSRQAAVILEKARAAGAKVVLVGDRLQHAAVEAGMPFAYLQEGGLKAVRLDEIRRQKDPELRAAVVEASEGRTRQAVARLEAQGQIFEHADPGQRHQAVVRDYLGTPRGQTCIVIAPSNDERRDLNRRIREALIETGQVEKASFQASIRLSRGLTQAQKKEVKSYQEGDCLTFQRGSRAFGIAQGALGTVTGVDLERKTVQVALEGGEQVAFAPARFRGAEVSRVETRRFAVGDRIQYREAQKPEGSRIQGQGFRIANGDTGIIRELDHATGRARIELEDRHSVQLDLGRVQPVDHAYAITSHASQGRTEDRSLVVVDTAHSRELVNKKQFYVSISRARLESRVYTDSREDLAAAVSRDAEKSSALALVRGHGKPKGQEVEDGRERVSGEGGPFSPGGTPDGDRGGNSKRAGGRVDLGREPGGPLHGQPSGGPGGNAEPTAAVAKRRGSPGRAAERGLAPARSHPGPHGGGRRGMVRLARTQPGLPGSHRPVPPGAGRGQIAPGRGPVDAPAGTDRSQGRGHHAVGGRLEEPGRGGAGAPERHGDRERRRETVQRSGLGSLSGLGREPDQRREPSLSADGGAHPGAPPSGASVDLDRGDPGDSARSGSAVEGRLVMAGHGFNETGDQAVLQREAGAEPLRVPKGMKHLEPDLQRLSARVRACGLEDPFREEALKAIPPAALTGALAEARGRGLLMEGPAWVGHRDQLPDLTEAIRRTLDQQMEMDRTLPGGRGR